MARSTEQVDDLLEWHPGPAQVASSGPFGALLWGMRRAASAKLLIFWLWLAHVLVGLGVARGALEALRSATPGHGIRQVLLGSSQVGAAFTAPALETSTRLVVVESIVRPLWSTSAFFVLFYGLLAGGAIVYLHAPRPAPLLPQLGAGCGTYLGRFVRLLVIAAAVSWALQSAGRLFFTAASLPQTAWLQLLLWQTTVALLAAVVDYSRVRTVARDSRSMVLETIRSARFFVRHLPRTLALELGVLLLAALVGAAALVLAGGLRAVIPEAAAGRVAELAWVAASVWLRLAAWAAMLSLYQGITLQRLTQERA